MAELTKRRSKGKAALKAGMDPRTGRKYGLSGKLPSASQPVHDWRTRPRPPAVNLDLVDLAGRSAYAIDSIGFIAV